MTETPRSPLGPGDRAPDFQLPAADREDTVHLAEHLRRGPVLLTLLRGLYCPFCRRHLTRVGQVAEPLRAAGIGLLGVVVASPQRARQYFGYRPTRFPVAAAPDRRVHQAYGLAEVPRGPELREETERRSAAALQEIGLQPPAGEASQMFLSAGGFEMTPEDQTEFGRARQTVGYFLIAGDGVIRWTRDDVYMLSLPSPQELATVV